MLKSGIVIGALLMGFMAGSVTTLVIVRPQSASKPVSASPFDGKTYSYYKAHPEEAKARWHDCGEHGISPTGESPQARDCEVAREVAMETR